MSIDMDKTDTLYEKINVIGNLIEQMMLMNAIGDKPNFAKAHSKASNLCFDAARQMEDMGFDDQD